MYKDVHRRRYGLKARKIRRTGGCEFGISWLKYYHFDNSLSMHTAVGGGGGKKFKFYNILC